jgi:hypothetical protein
MKHDPTENEDKNREEQGDSPENTDNWAFTAPVAPPRIKSSITKNVEGSRFVGGFMSTFLESLEATLKGVLGQNDEKH